MHVIALQPVCMQLTAKSFWSNLMMYSGSSSFAAKQINLNQVSNPDSLKTLTSDSHVKEGKEKTYCTSPQESKEFLLFRIHLHRYLNISLRFY